MLAARYLTGVKINANPKYIGTRLSNGYSVIVPTQTLVDTYRCTDGKRIDQSSLYNPKSPYQNRDPRLDYSIICPGGWHNNFKFEIHPDSTKTSAIINGKLTRIGNTEVTNAYGSFTGYVGRKYFDEATCQTISPKANCISSCCAMPRCYLRMPRRRSNLDRSTRQ